MTGVDKALATLRTAISGYSGTPLRWPDRGDALDALARVEAELSRLRAERDALDEARIGCARVLQNVVPRDRYDALMAVHVAAEARCARLEQEAVPYELVLLLEAAELKVQRLREERDTLTERDYWASQTIREQERECVRLRKMLGVRPDIDPETGYGRVEAI